jgi:hypothetical protein
MSQHASVYLRSIIVGIGTMLAAWLITLDARAAYLSIVYKIQFGPLRLDSSPLSYPGTWLIGVPAFLGGFAWQFHRSGDSRTGHLPR